MVGSVKPEAGVEIGKEPRLQVLRVELKALVSGGDIVDAVRRAIGYRSEYLITSIRRPGTWGWGEGW